MKKGLSMIFLTVFLVSAGCSAGLKPGYSMEDSQIAWKDYEQAAYDFYSGEVLTYPVLYTIERQTRDQPETYRIDFALVMEEGTNGTGAVVDADSLNPISSYNRQIPPEGSEAKKREFTGVYEKDKLNLSVVVGEKEQKLSVKIPQNTMDNESSLMMIRNLPLEEGFSCNLNLAVIASATVAPYTLQVEGVEEIQVPFGQFSCYNVVLKYAGKGSAPDIRIWYTADSDKVMVKYVSQNVRFELNAYETEKKEETGR